MNRHVVTFSDKRARPLARVLTYSQTEARESRERFTWTSVEDAVPEAGQRVLAWGDPDFEPGDPERVAIIADYLEGQWCSAELNDPVEAVTHWMPLPEGPE